VSALELTRAAGQAGDVEELEASARRYLALAGERALALDVASAEASLAKALDLTPAGHPERASLLESWAQAAQQQSRQQEAKAALEEALALYREQGEPLAAGRVLTALANVFNRLGDPRTEEVLAEALTLLEAQPPGPELVAAHTELAARRYVGSAYAEAIAAAERALALADQLGLPTPVRALGHRGGARSLPGDRRGLEDMRRALELAIEQGEGRWAATIYNNLSIGVWTFEGPQAALDLSREGIDFCERRGIAEIVLFIGGSSLTYLAELGRPEEALAEAQPLAERGEAAGMAVAIDTRGVQLRLLAERGEGEQEVAAAEHLVAGARTDQPQVLAMTIAAAAKLLLAHGRPETARTLLVELEQVPRLRPDPYYASLLPELIRCALALGEPELAARLVDGVQPLAPLRQHVLCTCRGQLAEAAGDAAEAAGLYAEAAERWGEFGNVPERAYALLGRGRSLLALGRPEAGESLRAARDVFAEMRYKPALAETEALLVEQTAAPAS
jgi:tetratricopeptide (TPR) repeat protein